LGGEVPLMPSKRSGGCLGSNVKGPSPEGTDAGADPQQVAKLLRDAQRTALRGGDPYRNRAYSRAADGLAALAIPLEVLIEKVGSRKFLASGTRSRTSSLSYTAPAHPSLEKLRANISAGVLDMLTAPGTDLVTRGTRCIFLVG
jgi:hypothetical protein